MRKAVIAGMAGLMLIGLPAVAKEYYPPKAANDEVSGSAIIECVVQADFSVKECVVIEETPKGYGFGKATVQLFEDKYKANLNPERPEDKKPGDHVKFSHQWNIG